MKGHDDAYQDMLDFLRQLKREQRHMLVILVEDLVGSKDTEALQDFAKVSTAL